jgi:hypothetical protein
MTTTTNPLVAPAQATANGTGINLLDDATTLHQAITSGSWVAGGLSAVGTGMDVVALATNPVATVVSYGLNYLIETVKPLHDALNWFAGDSGQISGYATTWQNVSQTVGQGSQTFQTSLTNDTANWTGSAATGYRGVATDTINTIKAASSAAGTLATVTRMIGSLVSAVRNLIRDLVTQAIGQVVQTALLAAEVITIPYVVCRVWALVASWMRRIADVVRKLSGSLSQLQPLMQRLAQLASNIKQALTKQYTVKTEVPPAPTPVPAPPATLSKPWPQKGNYRRPADYGRDKHEALKELNRPNEGTMLADGHWQLLKVERKAGGKKRVDLLYVNHETKQILVEDYFTGAVEPVEHASKGWQYQNEPEIQALIKQGYQYTYTPSLTDKTPH